MYESRLSYFNDKARINNCKPPSVYEHGGPSRPRQNCHSCIFETKENSNLRISILRLHAKNQPFDKVPCQAEVWILQKITLNRSVLPPFLPRQERLWQNFELPCLSDWDPKDLHLLDKTIKRRNNKERTSYKLFSRVKRWYSWSMELPFGLWTGQRY